MAHEVFISYTSLNKTAADGVCAGLEREKLRCWIAPRDVLPGSNYGESIINAIESAQVVVLIFSSASNLSPAVQREMERAMHFAKPIIPFRLEDVPMTKGMEFYLASCHWLDAMSPPIEKHISQLASAVHGLLGREWAGGSTQPPVSVARGRRASLILAGVLALLAASAGIFFFAHRQHAPAQQKERAALTSPANIPAGLSLDVQLRNPGEEPINDAFDKSFAALTRVRYEFQREDALLRVKLQCTYLQKVGEHAVLPILPATALPGTHFEPSPVVFVLQLLNDTTKVLSVHRVELQVSESVAELEPVLVLNADSAGLRILNEGWAPVENATLRVTSPEAARDSVAIAAFDQTCLVPWSELTKVKGAAASKLTGRIEYFWFNKEGVRNSGSFSFESKPVQASAPTSSVVPAPHPDAPTPLELQLNKESYRVTGALARQIVAGEHDVVEVPIMAARTSHHRFHLLVHYNDGQDGVLRSPEIDLEYFAPRAVAQ